MLCRYVRSLSRMRAVDGSFSSSVNLMSSMVGSGHHHGSITSRIDCSNNRMQQQVTSRSFGIITDTISKMVNNKMESDKGNVRPPMMTLYMMNIGMPHSCCCIYLSCYLSLSTEKKFTTLMATMLSGNGWMDTDG